MRVVLADDHRIVREGLGLIIAHDPEITIVGEVADGQALLDLLATEDVDVVLLDIKMPGLSGLDVLRSLQESGSPVKVIVLSMYDDPAYVERAIELGAAGYLLKSVNREELLNAVHAVADGASYIQGALSGPLVERLMSSEAKKSVSHLGVEERRLLELVADGLSNEEIGVEMALSQAAVKARLRSLCATLGVRRRSEAVAVAIRMGIVS